MASSENNKSNPINLDKGHDEEKAPFVDNRTPKEIRAYKLETVVLYLTPVAFVMGLGDPEFTYKVLMVTGFCGFMALIIGGGGARMRDFMRSAKFVEDFGIRCFLTIIPLHVVMYITFDRFHLLFEGGLGLLFVPLFYFFVGVCIFHLVKARKVKLSFWDYGQTVGEDYESDVLVMLPLFYIMFFSFFAPIFTGHAIGIL